MLKDVFISKYDLLQDYYKATGKCIDNSWEYMTDSRYMPKTIYLSEKQLKPLTSPHSPVLNYGYVKIPEYIHISYNAVLNKY